jgi:hypothetical protein
VWTLLEAAIQSVGRVRKAQERQAGLIKVLDSHAQELEHTKTIIRVVRDEKALQTAAVVSELVEVETIASKLVEVLQALEPGDKGSVRQLAHQVLHGSKYEKTLDNIMVDLTRAKSSLSLLIQVTNVGLTRIAGDKIVANVDVVNRVNCLLELVFGEGRGLKIAKLLENRSPRGISHSAIS